MRNNAMRDLHKEPLNTKNDLIWAREGGRKGQDMAGFPEEVPFDLDFNGFVTRRKEG